MDITIAKKASELLEEINKLLEYKKILENKEYGKSTHFEFCQHYGNNSARVIFDHKYTQRFIPIIEGIIEGLNEELLAL